MKLLFIIPGFLFSTIVCAQQGKPIIDTGMLGKWPDIQNAPKPVISPDGNYFAFVINNQPLKSNTFIIQGTYSSWRKEMVVENIASNYIFSRDSKKILWKNSDTLFFLDMESDKLNYKTKVLSIKYPFYRKGEWIAYQFENDVKEVILLNVCTRKELHFYDVTEYSFNLGGSALLIKTTSKVDNVSSIKWISLPDCKLTMIWSGTDFEKVSKCNFDYQGDQLTFTILQTKENSFSNSIWYYKAGNERAVEKINEQSYGIKNGFHLTKATASFSKNGKWLFFNIEQLVNEENPKPDAIKVAIWSYMDKILYHEQKPNNQRSTCVVDVNTGKIICLEKENERMLNSDNNVTGDYVVVCDNENTPSWWQNSPLSSYWLISLKDGKKTLLKKESKYPMDYFSFSHTGRWLLYWDSEKKDYISYDTKTGKSRDITETLPCVSAENMTEVRSYPIDRITSWYVGDTSFLVYDSYDIWKIDPAGKQPPSNITNGYGAKHHIKFRLVYEENDVLTGQETLLLTALNTLNKYNGFYRKNLNEKGDPQLLMMEPYNYYMVNSQMGHGYSFGNGMQPVQGGEGYNRIWIVQRQSATEYANYFITKDFRLYRSLTDLQPQKKYNWLTAELVTWKMFDGKMGQGVLYKPENFDRQKKYPVIFNYYEKLSHRLYLCPYPGLTNDNINIPWFVSRGYLVFTPDIYYSIASEKGGRTVGESAYNSVVSATKYLSGLPYVDGGKIAIQGHSFGGGETNYIATHSKLFAAACEASGTVSNEISAYLGFIRANGKPPLQFRLYNAESGHDMIGATLWQRPDLYIRSSSVFNADQVTAPFLIMHNQGDFIVDWGQSGEMYMALRRLGKKCWMLQYDNGKHIVDEKDEFDFTLRLTQFFDHYLKGELPARWMTQNSLAKYKGIDNLYELDSAGNCGPDCKVCKKINAEYNKKLSINSETGTKGLPSDNQITMPNFHTKPTQLTRINNKK